MGGCVGCGSYSAITVTITSSSLLHRAYADTHTHSCIVCDRPENYDSLFAYYRDTPVHVVKNGHLVSRKADFVIYSVEAEFIDRVVGEYGASTKVGAIVSAQTSVKAPERAAFERHLPHDVHVVSIHSLHGPTVSPEGQPLVGLSFFNFHFALCAMSHKRTRYSSNTLLQTGYCARRRMCSAAFAAAMCI